jgi:hypothetical protein
MAKQRMSWTTKLHRALACETVEEADMMARAMLGHARAIHAKLTYVCSRQHHTIGWVIYNETGSKMIADR